MTVMIKQRFETSSGQSDRFLRLAMAAVLAAFAAVAVLWGRLPTTLAVQFGFDARPISWLSKTKFVLLAAGFLTAELVVAQLLSRRTQTRVTPVLLAAILFELAVFGGVIAYNVAPGKTWSMLGLTVLSALVLLIVAATVSFLIARGRGRSLARHPPKRDVKVLGTFVHRSAAVFWVVIPVLLIQGWIWRTPGVVSKMAVLIVSVTMLWVGALALVGFRYIVREDGLLVKGLIRDVAFVSCEEMRGVSVSPADPMEFGGWGIRGTGRRRAFIWRGGEGVRLDIEAGLVFLGTDEPEALAGLLRGICPARSPV